MRALTLPVFSHTWSSPLGALLLLAHDRALCGVWFADQRGIPPIAHTAPAQPQHPLLSQAQEELDAFFQGRLRHFSVPVDTASGTPFQQSVWQALLTIPYGGTTTYGDLAQRVGRPQAVRAVGGAVGRNPLGIVLPCHRVVGAQGAMTGYTGGLERKIYLLRHEQSLGG